MCINVDIHDIVYWRHHMCINVDILDIVYCKGFISLCIGVDLGKCSGILPLFVCFYSTLLSCVIAIFQSHKLSVSSCVRSRHQILLSLTKFAKYQDVNSSKITSFIKEVSYMKLMAGDGKSLDYYFLWNTLIKNL